MNECMNEQMDERCASMKVDAIMERFMEANPETHFANFSLFFNSRVHVQA